MKIRKIKLFVYSLMIGSIFLIPNIVNAAIPIVDTPHTRIYYRGYKMTVKDLLDAAKKYEDGQNRESGRYYPVFPQMYS